MALGFLLDAQHVALRVKFGHPVPFRVVHPVSEDSGVVARFRILDGLPQQIGETLPVKNIVAQHQAGAIVANELLADDERLGQPVGAGLFRVGKGDAVVRPVAQQPFKPGKVVRRGDDEDILDPCEHKGGDGIIDHGFIVYRDKLLGDSFRDRIEAGAGPSGRTIPFIYLV